MRMLEIEEEEDGGGQRKFLGHLDDNSLTPKTCIFSIADINIRTLPPSILLLISYGRESTRQVSNQQALSNNKPPCQLGVIPRCPTHVVCCCAVES